MNTQIVFLKRTDRVLYSEGSLVLYEMDADVTPADYIKDSAQKACFAVVSMNNAIFGVPVTQTYPVIIRKESYGVSVSVAENKIYGNVFTDPGEDTEKIATNNKWILKVEQK